MKKIISILGGLGISFTAQAQAETPYIDRDMFAVGVAIFAGGFALLFVLEIVKRLFDYQLKRRALELGLSEIPGKPDQAFRSTIKWLMIWVGIGTGFTLIYLTLPLGIHSVAIMSFCLAASFLGYFIYLKQTRN